MREVQYHRLDRQSARAVGGGGRDGWAAVMVVRDPNCAIAATNYRAATTGDDDLFAVWVPRDDDRPERWDKRPVSHAELEVNFIARRPSGEDPHLGNYQAAHPVDPGSSERRFPRRGYMGGTMVHHSDEGGRRFVGTINLPMFAARPGRTRVCRHARRP